MDERLKQFVRHFLVALQGATRVPVAGAAARAGAGPELAAAGAPHLPGVGLLVGAAAAVVFAMVALLLPAATASALAAAVLAAAATAALTGATGEEAVTEWAGGAGSGRGTLALLLLVGARCTLLAVLAGLSPGGVLAALVAGHAVSRAWPLLAAPVGKGGLLVAAGWCLPALVLLLLAGGAGAVVLALAASGGALWLLLRRLRTAYAPGAAQQVCEVAFYFGTAVGLQV